MVKNSSAVAGLAEALNFYLGHCVLHDILMGQELSEYCQHERIKFIE